GDGTVNVVGGVEAVDAVAVGGVARDHRHAGHSEAGHDAGDLDAAEGVAVGGVVGNAATQHARYAPRQGCIDFARQQGTISAVVVGGVAGKVAIQVSYHGNAIGIVARGGVLL